MVVLSVVVEIMKNVNFVCACMKKYDKKVSNRLKISFFQNTKSTAIN